MQAIDEYVYPIVISMKISLQVKEDFAGRALVKCHFKHTIPLRQFRCSESKPAFSRGGSVAVSTFLFCFFYFLLPKF